jgi:choice-of-anchor C domain-containing protein
MRPVFLAAVVLTMPAAAAQAQILNGSFESASVDPGAHYITLNPGSTAITGWTVGPGAGIDYVGADWNASNGARSLDLNALNAGSIFQTFPTTPGQPYEVLFDMAANTGLAPPVPPVTMTMQVSAGGASQNYSFSTLGHSYSNMGWDTKQLLFTATGSTTTLTFTSTSTTTFSAGPTLDNVRLTLVPEPGSFLLATIGVASALTKGRGPRRRRSNCDRAIPYYCATMFEGS